MQALTKRSIETLLAFEIPVNDEYIEIITVFFTNLKENAYYFKVSQLDQVACEDLFRFSSLSLYI